MFLKIASINFWGLKKPASIDKEIRLKRLLEFIKKENLSIVCLQEIWLKQDLDFIINNLKGYYFAYKLNNKKTKNPSGLVILTKFEITEKGFIPFKKRGYEIIFKKGILFCDLELIQKEKKENIRIINTHLLATFKPLKSKIWQSQLEQLYSLFNNKKTIIFGDFNYNYNDFPFPDLKLISNEKIATRNTENYYNKKALNKFAKVNMVCDLIYSNFDLNVIEKSTITNSKISDHYPVVSVIEI